MGLAADKAKMECSAPAVEWEDLAVTAEGLAAVEWKDQAEKECRGRVVE